MHLLKPSAGIGLLIVVIDVVRSYRHPLRAFISRGVLIAQPYVGCKLEIHSFESFILIGAFGKSGKLLSRGDEVR